MQDRHIPYERTWALLMLVILVTLVAACEPELQPIRYGTDTDAFCRMVIVEPRFSGVILTDKGRTMKFDSIECLTGYVMMKADVKQEYDEDNIFVSIDSEGTLQSVSTSFFVISDSIRTPMGGGIVAYATDVDQAIKWSELKSNFKQTDNR